MVLTMRLGVLNPLFKDIFRLLNELTVQIDGVCRNAAVGVVLAEDEFRRLLVVLFHLAPVRFTLLRELFGFCAIAAGVRLFGLYIQRSTVILLGVMNRDRHCRGRRERSAPGHSMSHAWRLLVWLGLGDGHIRPLRRRFGRG